MVTYHTTLAALWCNGHEARTYYNAVQQQLKCWKWSCTQTAAC